MIKYISFVLTLVILTSCYDNSEDEAKRNKEQAENRAKVKLSEQDIMGCNETKLFLKYGESLDRKKCEIRISSGGLPTDWYVVKNKFRYKDWLVTTYTVEESHNPFSKEFDPLTEKAKTLLVALTRKEVITEAIVFTLCQEIQVGDWFISSTANPHYTYWKNSKIYVPFPKWGKAHARLDKGKNVLWIKTERGEIFKELAEIEFAKQ